MRRWQRRILVSASKHVFSPLPPSLLPFPGSPVQTYSPSLESLSLSGMVMCDVVKGGERGVLPSLNCDGKGPSATTHNSPHDLSQHMPGRVCRGEKASRVVLRHNFPSCKANGVPILPRTAAHGGEVRNGYTCFRCSSDEVRCSDGGWEKPSPSLPGLALMPSGKSQFPSDLETSHMLCTSHHICIQATTDIFLLFFSLFGSVFGMFPCLSFCRTSHSHPCLQSSLMPSALYLHHQPPVV